MKGGKAMIVQHRYLNLPVKSGAPKRTMRLEVGGRTVREFEIELAEGEPDFWVFAEVGAFKGERLTMSVDGLEAGAQALEQAYQSDDIWGVEGLYQERLRPQFHFSSRRGWNNDPNGLVYYEGEYHLFYQHNPYGWKWGNMHWGHAVSTDLVHWRELGDAHYPDRLGTIYSGSAVVDAQDTAGFWSGQDEVLVCVYTSAGGTSPASTGQRFAQSIAYSNDHGRTWSKYEGNPVLGHIAGRNRDPKVIWHEPSRQWIMALYLEEHDYALFGSADLKGWSRLCDVELEGASECPDFFPLAVDGDPGNTRWVFWGANGSYALGSFDGQTFRPEGEVERYDWGGVSYAAQTWSDIPEEDGRRIQIAWARIEIPGMPFNQMMTFPCQLTLRTTPEGIRLFSQPVREIEGLRRQRHHWTGITLRGGGNPLSGIAGECFEVRAQFGVGDAAQFGLAVRGIPVVYDVGKETLSCQGRTAPLKPIDGKIRLQLLVDRVSIEIFGNDGRIALPVGMVPDEGAEPLAAWAEGGEVEIDSLEAYELGSAWE